ncbi:hypothetical protein Lal_00045785 [Lupinus albus]|nr:hypothetical protein Lal_00045785 [Lupinus albus]
MMLLSLIFNTWMICCLLGRTLSIMSWFLKSILKCFELSYGLKINFHKNNFIKTRMQLLAPWVFGEMEFGHGISNGEGECFSKKKRNTKNFYKFLKMHDFMKTLLMGGFVFMIKCQEHVKIYYDIIFEKLRLFRLASNQLSWVANNGSWSNDVWSWEIAWRRSLFGREVSLAQNLYDLIRHHSCKRCLIDRWRCGLDRSGKYVLMRRRLTTNDELFKRNVIVRVDDMLCIFCNNHVETIDHLFLSCDFAASVWKGFYSWLQISVINQSFVLDSLKYHESIRKGNCAKLWRMFWFSVVWYIWLLRNEVIFLEKVSSYVHIIDLIQTRSWIWLSSFMSCNYLSFANWCMNPKVCLTMCSTK